MDQLNDLRSELPEQDITLLAGHPYVYHCHHFNLFHDQTIEDALGEEDAMRVRVQAAQAAFSQILTSLVRATGAETPAERLEIAQRLFAWMGQGKLDVLAEGPQAGHARGEHLHYSFAWREKYGQRIRRLFPVDAVAAGFAAAAQEVAYNLELGSLTAAEHHCYALRESSCQMDLEPATADSENLEVGGEAYRQYAAPSFGGQDEERIAAIARGLHEFTRGVGGDERGLIPAFNLLVTMHLPYYYNRTAYEAIHHVEAKAPRSVAAAEELIGESGHVCVFYTLGNMLLSAEWEALVGPLGDPPPEDIISYCCALVRGLGFGHWGIHEFVPAERLVLRTPSNYEAPFYRATYGTSDKPRCYFFKNSARAIMQLAHRVEWATRPQLNEQLYLSLFRSGLSWHTEETRCVARGDELCEVVVTRA